MQYFYVFLWGIIALYLYAITKKQGVPAFVAALFFTFMTVWYALRSFGGMDMFDGTLGIIFKIVLVVFLLLCIAYYVVMYRKRKKQSGENDDDDCRE